MQPANPMPQSARNVLVVLGQLERGSTTEQAQYYLVDNFGIDIDDAARAVAQAQLAQRAAASVTLGDRDTQIGDAQGVRGESGEVLVEASVVIQRQGQPDDYITLRYPAVDSSTTVGEIRDRIESEFADLRREYGREDETWSVHIRYIL